MNDFSYCRIELKHNDYYRYLCYLFASHSIRKQLSALYAFNSEIAGIKDVQAIKWWIEAISEIYSGQPVRDHKILKALAEVIQSSKIPREYFEHIIIAHEFDLGVKQIPNSEIFQKYIDDTSTNLFKAAFHIIGIKNEIAFKVAHHIGTAYALIEQIRTIKWGTPRRHILIPQGMLEKHSLHLYDIAANTHPERLKPIVQEYCKNAEFHLKQANELKKSLPEDAKPIYIHSTLATIFLQQLHENNYDLFNKNFSISKRSLFIKIFLAEKFGIGQADDSQDTNINSNEPYNSKIIDNLRFASILFSFILFVATAVYQLNTRESAAHDKSLSVYQSCTSINKASKNPGKHQNCANQSGQLYTQMLNNEKSDYNIFAESFMYFGGVWLFIIIPLSIFKRTMIWFKE